MHGMRVVLVGGRSIAEREMAGQIMAAVHFDVLDQVGKDTLPQLLGLQSRSTALLSPDSGPAHMATMVGLPVIGLYAATNPERAGPYYSRQWCVDRYDAAARKYLARPASQIPWTTKIERPGVMDLIEVRTSPQNSTPSWPIAPCGRKALKYRNDRNKSPDLTRGIAGQDHHPAHQV
jgi:heptosyltransferase I